MAASRRKHRNLYTIYSRSIVQSFQRVGRRLLAVIVVSQSSNISYCTGLVEFISKEALSPVSQVIAPAAAAAAAAESEAAAVFPKSRNTR